VPSRIPVSKVSSATAPHGSLPWVSAWTIVEGPGMPESKCHTQSVPVFDWHQRAMYADTVGGHATIVLRTRISPLSGGGPSRSILDPSSL
jgi:hypothetical protein